ncbi:MAG TPA: lipid IV(A) 3-deoxy-D-manno-octulosonic acid transferase [Steroidobacteraceae bacterium]|nr:lipid IV(A) 3-deoxy-D-manno-octulosonic acid transferase [Steroidobacteraceae bacterium]
MRFLYIALAYLLTPFALVLLLWRGLRDRVRGVDGVSYSSNLHERFGYGRHEQQPSIWVHAVSMGEVQASAALVRSLSARYPQWPLVLTTVTPTGAQRARALFGAQVHVRYIPFDLPGCVRRFFDRVQPRLAIILETELWPNLYHECGHRKVPLVLASARISPRSVHRYRRLVSLFRETLSHGIVIAAQSASDAERFKSIGANPAHTHVIGNIKFDFELPAGLASEGRRLREHYAAGRAVWIAGSTHEGEEDMVLDAHVRIRQSVRAALLVLVPRHPNRFDAVATNLRRRGVRFVARSTESPVSQDTEVLLVDTVGQLLTFYGAADVAFVGGSLVPIGGHNLLEPAALRLPILTGPHNFNSEDIAKLLVEVGAQQVVHDTQGLSDQVTLLLSDPAERERRGGLGRRALDENRGALKRLLDLIDPLLRERSLYD